MSNTKIELSNFGSIVDTNIKNMILRKIKVIPFIANTDLEKGEYYNKYIAFIFEVDFSSKVVSSFNI